jgi:hypothetical protein
VSEQPKETSPGPGPITDSPDLRKWRKRRAWIRRYPKLHWAYEKVFVPAEVPEEFNESLADLQAKLQCADEKTTPLILEEAEATFAEPHARIESAERRATTLQGTVAIAASLTIGGARLVFDKTTIDDHCWRLAFAAAMATFIVCLIGCVIRAVGASSRIFAFEQPGIERIFDRAKLSAGEASAQRAAELLRAAGVASEVAAVKVGLLRSAVWWFRLALLVLGVIAGLIVAYAVSA